MSAPTDAQTDGARTLAMAAIDTVRELRGRTFSVSFVDDRWSVFDQFGVTWARCHDIQCAACVTEALNRFAGDAE